MIELILVGIGAAAFFLLVRPDLTKWRAPLYLVWLGLAAVLVLNAIAVFSGDVTTTRILGGINLLILAAAALGLLVSVDPSQMDRLRRPASDDQPGTAPPPPNEPGPPTGV
jgi:hypothetical protein